MSAAAHPSSRVPSRSPSLARSAGSESDFELITPSKSSLKKRSAPSPSPSPSLSSGDDRTSDFEPDVADEEQDEYKPDTIDLDEYAAPSRGKKGKAGGAKKRKVDILSSGGSTTGSVNGKGGGKGAGYTAEEDLALFHQVRPKISPSWASVASKVGRDAKSCQNRWPVLEKKIIGAILGQCTPARSAGKGGAYTAAEDTTLFNQVRPKVSPNWAVAAANVGRDAKNRWPVLNKRIESFIKGG